MEIAAAGGGSRPTFFAEKCLPENNVPQLLWELYGDAREIFLTRDFRDMVCSIRAFNEKRGRDAFGTTGLEGDEAFIRQLAPSVDGLRAQWRARRDRAHLVRYEDLVMRPRETLAGALAYLGTDAGDGLVDAMLAQAGEEIPGMADHRTAASGGASVGRWERGPARGLRRLCEEAFGPALEEFGYR